MRACLLTPGLSASTIGGLGKTARAVISDSRATEGAHLTVWPNRVEAARALASPRRVTSPFLLVFLALLLLHLARPLLTFLPAESLHSFSDSCIHSFGPVSRPLANCCPRKPLRCVCGAALTFLEERTRQPTTRPASAAAASNPSC